MAEQASSGFAGLPQQELAKAAGVSPRSVSDLERGITHTARQDTAVRLAGALGLAEPARSLFVAAALGASRPRRCWRPGEAKRRMSRAPQPGACTVSCPR